EEEELINDAFRLEVSSPGLDHPITLLRQYEKNVGRQVKITLNDGLSHTGKLLTANDNEITIEQTIKKENKKLTILFKDIQKTQVQVSF
ncbi:MAG: ribosome maturation factor RimP, partial [Cyclobacteriaceae bacterium]|nr:ribosome maturation factor RimP [Cyclobacteriaceae bacterium]